MATEPVPSGTAPRVANRYKTSLPCAVEQNGASKRAHILNMSLTGAMIATLKDVQPRQSIWLRFDTKSYRAFVVWSRDQRAGLRFNLPLLQPTLQNLIA